MEYFIKRLLANDAIKLIKMSKVLFFFCLVPSLISYCLWGIWGKEQISQYLVTIFGLLSVPYLAKALQKLDGNLK